MTRAKDGAATPKGRGGSEADGRVRRRAWLIPLCSILLVISGYLLPRVGVYNGSPSAPRGFYLYQEPQLQRGQYVLIPVPAGVEELVTSRGWLPAGVPLLKQIGALPGDKVLISAREIRVNGAYIGSILETDQQGLPLPRLRGEFTIPDGQFLPLSLTYDRSFDGRYFGPVPISSILDSVAPLLVFRIVIFK